MNKRYRHLALPVSIVLVAAAVGCSAGQQRTESPTGEDQIATAVAQTLEAVPTATAPRVADAPADAPEPSPTDIPTSTPEPKPTDTPGPTNTPGASGCSDDSNFIADVNFPDDSPVTPGQTFTKIWRIQNNGSCTWTADHQLAHISGVQMGAPPGTRLAWDVPPGESYDVSVTFIAPTEPGTYRSRFQLRTPDGALFGDRPYVQIVVPAPTDVPVPTDTPTQESIEDVELREEIYFPGPALPPPSPLGHCHYVAPQPGEDMPTVRVFRGPDELGSLCLFGFSIEGEMTVNLHIPGVDHFSYVFELGADGRIIQTHPAGDEDTPQMGAVFREVDRISEVEIFFWWPAGLPAGEWSAVVNDYPEILFDVTYDSPMISTVPAIGIALFENHYCDSYLRDESMVIVGTGFDPNENLPLGIYWRESPRIGILVQSRIVTTDSRGDFSTPHDIESSDLSGAYYVVAVTDPDIEFDNSMLTHVVACYRVP